MNVVAEGQVTQKAECSQGAAVVTQGKGLCREVILFLDHPCLFKQLLRAS